MKQVFGSAPDGAEIDLYTLSNAAGMRAQVTNYGGIVTALLAPDREGRFGDVVLGFDGVDGYLKKHPHFGAICGRYANRIAGGRFILNGVEYNLARNDGDNHLHGGIRGFDKVVWQAAELASKNGAALRLTYSSPAGEEGYPARLNVAVTYALTDSNELRLDYVASTDADTVLNLTHHGYFNLADGGTGEVLEHEVMIDAARFLPVDAALIPIGELRDVRSTPMDFNRATAIGTRIDRDDEQLVNGRGYDHTWVVNGEAGQLRLAARVRAPTTGRVMEVLTTEPAVQLYTGNFLDGTITGKGGTVYRRRSGLCLECQHFPDSPNRPQFPSTVLKPGQRYTQTTVYRFSVG